jgi:FdhE protein
MTIVIQALIEQRPHLKDPLELYAKWQRFHREIGELLPKTRSTVSAEDSTAYPREIVGPVFSIFVSLFDLSAEKLEPLRRALEEGKIDFMRLPLGELPALSLPLAEDEVAAILFLLSRPYFLALRETSALDGVQWTDGRCPLCSARPALASITEGPKRRLHCSFCDTAGPYRFIGCPNCETTDPPKLNTILSDDEPGFRIITCEKCRTYVKVLENPVIKEMGLNLADLASLPLDIVAQEKGYARTAPNPIGLKKMV